MIDQTLVNGISAGLCYALVGLGLALVFEVCGFFDLGQGGVYLAGFYLTFALSRSSHLPLSLAVPLGSLLAGAVGLLAYTMIYAPLKARAAGTVSLLVASLSVLSLIESTASMIWGPDTLTLDAANQADAFEIGTARVAPMQAVSFAVTILVYVAVGIARSLTSWGRHVKAIASDRELAEIFGVPVARTTMLTVGVASTVTGLAGVLAGLDTDMSPGTAFPAVLMAWVTTVLGGIGRISNTLVAGLFLGLLQHIPMIWVSSAWQEPILYGFLLVTLLLRPRGISTAPTESIQR